MANNVLLDTTTWQTTKSLVLTNGKKSRIVWSIQTIYRVLCDTTKQSSIGRIGFDIDFILIRCDICVEQR